MCSFKMFATKYLHRFALMAITVVLTSKCSAAGFFEDDQTPPHCTHITKDTDYVARYKFNYPVVFLSPGQPEGYQRLYCVNPSTVNKVVSSVCDWVAPPRVQYTFGDGYLHIVRQDPSGRYHGNAVVTTMQFCQHNNTNNVTVPEAYNDGLVSSITPSITQL